MIQLPETPLIRNGLTFTQFRVSTDTTDNRKRKEYVRTVAVHASIEQEADTSGSSPFLHLQVQLETAFRSALDRKVYLAGGWGKHSVSVVFAFSADRPSDIQTEEEAWESLPWLPGEIAATIVEAFCTSHEAWKEQQALDKRVSDANHIRGWAVRSINAQAKLNVLYAERRKKLEEEYALAATAAFNTGWEAMQAEVLDKHPEFDARSVRVAFSAAASLVGKCEDPFNGLTFPSISRDLLK